MSLDDWILALHVLSAFALAGATTMSWVAGSRWLVPVGSGVPAGRRRLAAATRRPSRGLVRGAGLLARSPSPTGWWPSGDGRQPG